MKVNIEVGNSANASIPAVKANANPVTTANPATGLLRSRTKLTPAEIASEVARDLAKAATATNSLKSLFPSQTGALASLDLNLEVHIEDTVGVADPCVVLAVVDKRGDFTCTRNATTKLSNVATMATDMFEKMSGMLRMLEARDSYIKSAGHDLSNLTIEAVLDGYEVSQTSQWVLGKGTASFDSAQDMLSDERLLALQELYEILASPKLRDRASQAALRRIMSNSVDANKIKTQDGQIRFSVTRNETGFTFVFPNYLVQLKSGMEAVDYEVHIPYGEMQRKHDYNHREFEFAMGIYNDDVQKALRMALERQPDVEGLQLPAGFESCT